MLLVTKLSKESTCISNKHESKHELGNPSANLRNSVQNPYSSASTIRLYHPQQEEAIEIIGSALFTRSELGTRIRIGRDVMELTVGESLLNNDKLKISRMVNSD